MEAMVRGIPIHYEQFGEGIPILMIHGWPADNRHMTGSFEPLFHNRDGWKRIYPDLPGMGKTPKADWITNQDGMLEAVLGFVDEVIPKEPFAVAGVSYGGLLIQGLIYRIPEKILGAAFLVPSLDIGQEEKNVPDQITLVRDEAVEADLLPFESDVVNMMVTAQSPEIVEVFRRDVFPAFDIADHDFLEKVNPGNLFKFSFDVNNLPEPFKKPALFLSGRQDSLWGYSDGWKILHNFTRASYAVLDRAGHSVILEQNVLFAGLMHEWLDRVEESLVMDKTGEI